MTVTRVAIVGIDESTSIDWMRQVGDSYPFVEWSVLLSSQGGRARYPTIAWIERMRSVMHDRALSIHVSGVELEELLLGTYQHARLVQRFSRVQLYYRAGSFAPIGLRSYVSSNAFQSFTSTLNGTNMAAWRSLTGLPNHGVVFGESGGLGIAPGKWQIRLPQIDCGWSGGIAPENMAESLEKIQLASLGDPFWISMEGRLCGTDGRLDPVRVEESLEAVKSWNRASTLSQAFG